MSLSEKDLDFWLENSYNCLFIGKHGIGKSEILRQTMERHGIKYAYFSAATMDPWTDFVGIPRISDDENPVVDLIPPRQFGEDSEIEVLIIDEYNRAPPKVRNGCMELVQFKTINGRHFPKLRCIWAAINPPDVNKTYNVQQMDPAEMDRFHVQVELKYAPSIQYFTGKYGKEISTSVIEWWKSQGNDVQEEISPRRLDYAVEAFLKGGNPKHYLGISGRANVQEFSKRMKSGSLIAKLKVALEHDTDDELREFLNDANDAQDLVRILSRSTKGKSLVTSAELHRILTLLDGEKRSALVAESMKDPAFKSRLFKEMDNSPKLRACVLEATEGQDLKAASEISGVPESLDVDSLVQSLSGNGTVYCPDLTVSSISDTGYVISCVKDEITASDLPSATTYNRSEAYRSSIKWLNVASLRSSPELRAAYWALLESVASRSQKGTLWSNSYDHFPGLPAVANLLLAIECEVNDDCDTVSDAIRILHSGSVDDSALVKKVITFNED